MTNKNPYENGVDIPDFVEKKDDDIDMSVFKMADEQANNNFDIEDDEYEDDEEPRRKLSPKGLIIIGGIVIVLLLVAAVSGWIFGISKNNSLNKLEAEYTTLKTKYDDSAKQVEDLTNQITIMKAEAEKAASSSSSSSTEEAPNTKYKMEGDVSVRKSAGSKEFADFNKLPDAVADQLYNNEDLKTLTTRDGAILPVYETKDVSGNTWGRIADNAWVCLKFQGEEWGHKQ